MALCVLIRTLQKMKFSIKFFPRKREQIHICEQIRSLLWICPNLFEKSLLENLIFVRYCTNALYGIIHLARTQNFPKK